MKRRFKIVYYFLVAVFTIVFSYQIYLLITLIADKPKQEAGAMAAED